MPGARNSLLKIFITHSQTKKKIFLLYPHYWNNLPNNTKASNSFDTFINHLAQEKPTEKLKFIFNT